MLKTIVTYRDQSDQVSIVMKIRQDNYVIDRIDEVYVKNEIELSWSIKPNLVYNKNQTGYRRDQLYKCDPC